MKNRRTEFPYPDKKRKKWLNLNGEWDFSFDAPTFERIINVPFSWTCPLSGINLSDKRGTGYYRKKVTYNYGKNRLFICFVAVDYECEVYVNGNLVKSHKGGYCPFEADVTDVWDANNENEIIVKATDNDLEYQMSGKQGYGNVCGIWQSVFLEERPQSYIESFVITTKINGEISVKTKICGNFDKIVAIADEKTFEYTSSDFNFTVEKPKLWSYDSPNLYKLVLKLYNENSIDEVETYFGIREIGTAEFNGEQCITLNNKPIFISSVLDQSYNPEGFFTLPTDKYAEEEIIRMKDIGLNAVRIHIKTEDPIKLYWADKYGILVIEDIPCFWGNPTEQAKEYFETQMYEIIDRDINHPSVFYWVIFNETWGIKTVDKTDKKKWVYETDTQAWVKKLYLALKQYDKTRLVEDNSPCLRDHVITDVNSWHFYCNGYENVKNACESVSQKFVEGSGENYIADNVMGKVPVMNSECGNYWWIKGGAGDSDISWGYKYMVNEFRLKSKICGYVFTEFKDVTNEFNGIYRLDNTIKKFNYNYFNNEMSINDLHSDDYLGFDYAPCKTVKPGENVEIPLFVSSFTDKNHGKNMKIVWRADNHFGTGETETYVSGTMDIRYSDYGTTQLGKLNLTMPDIDGLTVVIVSLYDGDKMIMTNFILFDVYKESNGISIGDLKTEGFKQTHLVQQGNKLNCLGHGSISFQIDKSKLMNDDKVEIFCELSSKETLTKDDDNNESDSAIDLDFMRGYSVDRGQNPNSFYMTDDEKYPSKVTVYADGILIDSFVLEDDPADSSGYLSWHYQNDNRLLDEAGSYGYLCHFVIDGETYKKLDKQFSVKIESENGLSVFGRKSGKYPIGICVK